MLNNLFYLLESNVNNDFVNKGQQFFYDNLPSVPNIEVPHQEIIDFLVEIFTMVYYFIPVNQLLLMLIAILTFRNISFLINLGVKIWRMLPFT